jgi:hypothetical protein
MVFQNTSFLHFLHLATAFNFGADGIHIALAPVYQAAIRLACQPQQTGSATVRVLFGRNGWDEMGARKRRPFVAVGLMMETAETKCCRAALSHIVILRYPMITLLSARSHIVRRMCLWCPPFGCREHLAVDGCCLGFHLIEMKYQLITKTCPFPSISFIYPGGVQVFRFEISRPGAKRRSPTSTSQRHTAISANAQRPQARHPSLPPTNPQRTRSKAKRDSATCFVLYDFCVAHELLSFRIVARELQHCIFPYRQPCRDPWLASKNRSRKA